MIFFNVIVHYLFLVAQTWIAIYLLESFAVVGAAILYIPCLQKTR